MTTHKLTDRWISSCPLPKSGRISYVDAICPGLHLRITCHATKSFSVMLRVGGRLRRRTLGRYPAWSLAEARKEALRLQREVGEGIDAPAPAMSAAAPAKAAGMTYAALVESHVDLHQRPNNRSWKGVRASLLQPAMEPFLERDAASITRAEVVAVLDSLVAVGKPHAAVNLLKAVRAMYNWGMDRDAVPGNPCERVRPPARTTQRSRVLTDAEIVAVLLASDKMGPPFGPMVKMLFHTGCRRNEVAHMRWSELSGNLFTLPAERSKSGRENVLPLPPAAMAILAGLPRHGEDGYVFTTTRGRAPSSSFSKNKPLLDRASGVAGWTLHDIRRTCRTKLSQLGVVRDVARRIVGHAGDTLDETYDRHSFVEQKEAGLRLLAEHLSALMRSSPGSDQL